LTEATIAMLLKVSTHAYSHPALAKRGTTLAYSALATLGRKTITGMLSTSGVQFTDRSAHHRLFEREQVQPSVFSRRHSITLAAISTQRVHSLHSSTIPCCRSADDALLAPPGGEIHSVRAFKPI